ncbi:hypothetical protein [Alloactinosynnema sp. L-07]|uniref:hypothetical protein n=1 Tax=Alloactinosynnema sp. L-07 TaxID=1653480 RepID=UPI00065EFAA5|nr:hypothetical protein [Alloactinosynnema sp. L-07]CRK58534.1 hypothetical protein [Alloactinosynnema sp. L-07]
MLTLRLTAVAVLAVLLTGCGTDDKPTATPPPTKAEVVGSAPQDSPEKLYAEYVTRLSKADGAGTCALFTPGGVVAFEDEWRTEGCELVVTKAAGKIADVAAFAAKTTPKSNVKDSDTVVELSGCAVGGMKVLKSDKGWLIDAYRHPDAVAGC